MSYPRSTGQESIFLEAHTCLAYDNIQELLLRLLGMFSSSYHLGSGY